MATYKKIQATVKRLSGFTVETCWIAHVLSHYRKNMRTAWNRLDPNRRARPCPDQRRWQAIMNALQSLRTIPATQS